MQEEVGAVGCSVEEFERVRVRRFGYILVLV
jgi:hypothetical protein